MFCYRLGSARQEHGRAGVVLEVQPIEPIECTAVDRDGQKLASYIRQHPMFVRTPAGKPGEVSEDLLAVGMEDMRSIFMD